MKFRQLTEETAIQKLIEERFPRIGLSEQLRNNWRRSANAHGDEFQEAFNIWHVFNWWEIPSKVLFSDFAGLGFLPNEVFSYFLPQCIHQCYVGSTFDPVGHTLYRLAHKSYEFQGLNQLQLLTLGWFLCSTCNRDEYRFDGSLNIALSRLGAVIERVKTSEASELTDTIAECRQKQT